MSASVIDIVLRIRNETERVVSNVLTSLKSLATAVDGLGSTPGVASLKQQIASIQPTLAADTQALREFLRAMPQGNSPPPWLGSLVSLLHSVTPASQGASAALTQVSVTAQTSSAAITKAAAAIDVNSANLAALVASLKGVTTVLPQSLNVGNASQSIEGLVTSIRGLAAAFAGLLYLGTLRSWADAAAEVQVAGTVLSVVANNAGITTSSIKEADSAIQKMGITAKASAEGLTQFLQAGLAGIDGSAITKAKELARAAQDLAVVSGENSSATFSRLITNIQQMDTMGLRFMGITVDMATAEERFAESIGKTANALTGAERKQSFLNETLKEAKKLTGTYEAALGDTAKQIQSMPRYYNELKVALGEGLQPAYYALVMTLKDFLQGAGKIALRLREDAAASKELGESVKRVAVAVKDSALWLLQHKDIILTVIQAWLGFKALSLVSGYLSGASRAIGGTIDGLMRMHAAVIASMGPGSVSLIARFSAALGVSGVAGALRSLAAGGAVIPGVLSLASASFVSLGSLLAGVASFAGPIALLAFTVYQLWDAFVPKKKVTLGAEEVAEAKKRLNADIDAIIDAQKALLESERKLEEAPRGANLTGLVEERALAQQALNDAHKKAEAEANGLKITQRGVAERIALRKSELEVNRKVAEIEAELDAAKQARQRLGITDNNNKTEVGKAQELGTDLLGVYRDVYQKLVGAAESGTQQLQRVLLTSGLNQKQLVAQAAELGLSLSELMTKFYPKPEVTGSWNSLSEALARSGTAGRKAFSEFSVGFDKLVAGAKSPQEVAIALETISTFASIIPERAQAAAESLKLRGGKQALDQLNVALGGFDAKLKTVRDSLETVAGLDKDALEGSRKWETALVELKGAFIGFGQHLYAVSTAIDASFIGLSGNLVSSYVDSGERAVSLFRDTTNQVAQLTARASQESLQAALTKYNAEESLLKESYARRAALLAEQPKTSAESEDAKALQAQEAIIAAANSRMLTLTAKGQQEMQALRDADLERVRDSLSAEYASVEFFTKEIAAITVAHGRDLNQQEAELLVAHQAALQASNEAITKLKAEQTNLELSESKKAATEEVLIREQQYKTEEAIIGRANERIRELSKSIGLADAKAEKAAKEALDKEHNEKRLANAKTLYASLKALSDTAFSEYRASLDKVKSLDKELYTNKERKESDIRDLKRKGMSEEQVQADKLREYYELLAKAEEATAAGAYEKAKEYALSAKDLAKGLASLPIAEQVLKVSDAWDAATLATQKNKEETEKTAAKQHESFTKLSEALNTTSGLITKLTSEELKPISIGIDDEALGKALKKVQEAFANLEVTVKVKPTTDTDLAIPGVPGFAGGGPVYGPGTETSDSILAAVSRNEYIQPASAVRHYGSSVMDAIRRLALPRGVLMAALRGSIPSFSGGGSVGPLLAFSGPSSPTEELALSLTFNNRPLGRVTGSRETIHNIVSALKEVSRGT